MRVILSNVTCDWCEQPLETDIDNDTDMEEALQACGWLIVEEGGRLHDFCSRDCLRSWA